MNSKSNKLTGCFLLLVLLIGCNSRKEKILEFYVRDYRNAKIELRHKFGNPDSTIAFCNNDTAYLYKVDRGCVEWRFLANNKYPYKVKENDSCKIDEGKYEVFDYQKKAPTAIPMGVDTSGWPTFYKLDSAIRLSTKGHYTDLSYSLEKADSGLKGILFKKISAHKLDSKKSVRDAFCLRFGGAFILEYKYGTKIGSIYLGSSNFPDTSYVSLLNELEIANKALYSDFQRYREVIE